MHVLTGSPLARMIAATIVLAVLTAVGLSGAGRQSASEPSPPPAYGHALYAVDITNRDALVDFGANVFFGRVNGREGARGLAHREGSGSVPMSQYKVKVIANIKGRLSGHVIVSQYGGIDSETGELFLLEGDPLLQPGKEYLFVTNPNEQGWQVIVAPAYANIRIDDKAERAAIARAFEAATGLQMVSVDAAEDAPSVTETPTVEAPTETAVPTTVPTEPPTSTPTEIAEPTATVTAIPSPTVTAAPTETQTPASEGAGETAPDGGGT